MLNAQDIAAVRPGTNSRPEDRRRPTEWAPADARRARPWLADRVERWPIERLIPYANHTRLHTEADLDKIAAAIRKWGWTMPVLVDENGVLIVGHARVGAAAKLGLAEVPVMISHG
jgi:hypothetical protein